MIATALITDPWAGVALVGLILGVLALTLVLQVRS